MQKIVFILSLLISTFAQADSFPNDWHDVTKTYWQNATVQDVESKITNGADVNARDKYEKTPLMWASSYNKNPAVIITLIKAGAKLNAWDKYLYTPLILASSLNKNPAVVSTLIDAGANVRAKDANGKTAYDHILENDDLKDSKARYKLNDLRFK